MVVDCDLLNTVAQKGKTQQEICQNTTRNLSETQQEIRQNNKKKPQTAAVTIYTGHI